MAKKISLGEHLDICGQMVEKIENGTYGKADLKEINTTNEQFIADINNGSHLNKGFLKELEIYRKWLSDWLARNDIPEYAQPNKIKSAPTKRM